MNRTYIPSNLTINSWEAIEPYYKDLTHREINCAGELKQWLKDRSELEAMVSEEMGWRYIKTNCHTDNKNLSDAYKHFINNIYPLVTKHSNELDKKLIHNPFIKDLKEKEFMVMLRTIKKRFEIFCEENIALFTDIQNKEQEYGKITGAMTIEYQGNELTLQQASNHLKDTDRAIREDVFKKIQTTRLEQKDALNALLTDLIHTRHQVAENAGFNNFRDFKFADLGRFDYTPDDCYTFHESIKSEICPMVDQLLYERKTKLQLDQLRPWDLSVDVDMKPPLKPFSTVDEFIDKTITAFTNIRPQFGSFIETMKTKGHFDLESRKGKAPGGFNYPLYESNIPFIFMNATHNLRDLETIMHECGHAIHSFLSGHLELLEYKDFPSEVAELASMSMELISMDQWHLFFDQKEDLVRAKRNQLEGVLNVFPWVAIIDRFQQWLYTHPHHDTSERTNAWLEIHAEFGDHITNWNDLNEYRSNIWQKQLHIFEVPLYYIEYAIAELGAIAIWRNYRSNPSKALDQYEQALSLGYTATIPEIFKTAGIRFDFSKEYIAELMSFVKDELNNIV
jgi:oligoendopeptidase F